MVYVCVFVVCEMESVYTVYSFPINNIHLLALPYAFIYEFNEWKKAAATNKLTEVYRNF